MLIIKTYNPWICAWDKGEDKVDKEGIRFDSKHSLI